MKARSLALEASLDHKSERKADLTPVLQVKGLPNSLWTQSILIYISNLEDLGHLAKTSKAARSVLFQYLEYNEEQLSALIEYINAADRIAFLESKKGDVGANAALINATADVRRASLQDIEDKRPVKKSTFARVLSFIPGSSLILSAVPKFLASNVAREVGEVALATRLLPTCRNKYDDIVTNIMELCAHSWPAYIQGYGKGEDPCACDFWSRTDIEWGTFPPSCNFAMCVEITNDLLKNAANNEWDGGWLVAGGIAALIVAGIIFIPLGRLSNVSIEKILSQPFSKIFNEDLQERIREILLLDKSVFNKLSVTQVLHQLNEVEKIAIQNKNRLLCSAPIRELQQTLFFKIHPEAKKKTEVVVDIEVNTASEDRSSLTTPLIAKKHQAYS